jgi:hypothetical protein
VVLLKPLSLIGREPLSWVRAKLPESCWLQCYQGSIGHNMMSVSSHSGNGTAAELGRDTMSVLSHASDDAAEVTWS